LSSTAITWEALAAVIVLLLTGAGALGGVWWAIHQRITKLAERVEQVRAKGAQELADYKLTVAREYATAAAIKEVESKVVEAINRLGDRFDRYFDPSAPTAARRRRGSSV